MWDHLRYNGTNSRFFPVVDQTLCGAFRKPNCPTSLDTLNLSGGPLLTQQPVLQIVEHCHTNQRLAYTVSTELRSKGLRSCAPKGEFPEISDTVWKCLQSSKLSSAAVLKRCDFSVCMTVFRSAAHLTQLGPLLLALFGRQTFFRFAK